MLKRLFVANRGEIAVRIIKACRELGVEAVVGVSTADRDSLAAQLADRAVCIGPPAAGDSYLKKEALVAAALGTGCDAVHPGYGFLAENAAFQRLCDDNGLVFVGPKAEVIEAMGDKVRSRAVATEVGVPVTPGSDRIQSVEDAMRAAESFGYPILLKASAGGGGRGMRLVRDPAELRGAFEGAQAEARSAFGDPSIYMERYVERARHVEVQVMGDAHGTVRHFGERDCSVQRRYQKLLEEAPSPSVDAELRSRMSDAAVRLAQHVNYTGAGTVEFILDDDTKDFYFLEMNTRIQVEHPVTEMVTGADLVAEQIRVASGEPLAADGGGVRMQGHAIECRINAERPERNFQPSPGKLEEWRPPEGEGIRLDSHCYRGYAIPPFYDSMIGKLIVHGSDRADAIERMAAALDRFVVEGIYTTIPFHRALLADEDFRQNRITTKWVEEKFMARWSTACAK